MRTNLKKYLNVKIQKIKKLKEEKNKKLLKTKKFNHWKHQNRFKMNDYLLDNIKICFSAN